VVTENEGVTLVLSRAEADMVIDAIEGECASINRLAERLERAGEAPAYIVRHRDALYAVLQRLDAPPEKPAALPVFTRDAGHTLTMAVHELPAIVREAARATIGQLEYLLDDGQCERLLRDLGNAITRDLVMRAAAAEGAAFDLAPLLDGTRERASEGSR
jgi:hypothetical protein